MNSDIYKEQIKLLRDVVENLASTAKKQIEYLEALGVGPIADELALELDAFVGMLDVFYSEGLLSKPAAEYIRITDSLLDDMSGPNDLWSFDALKNRDEWEQVRKYARLALEYWDNGEGGITI